VDTSDVQTEISKIPNKILILQSETGDTERILRLEEKTQNISLNLDAPAISNTLKVEHAIIKR
jgi:hypothetical protein